FPHLFVTSPMPARRANDVTYPRHGTYQSYVMGFLGPAVQLGIGARSEANRILLLADAARHEALGAFVAGLQAALALVGKASMVGAVGGAEGYFLLPSTWHVDWETAWTATSVPALPVSRVCVSC